MRYFRPAGDPPKIERPLFLERVPAGFPSPARDYEEERIDLNKYFAPSPLSIFYVRADGDSMHPIIRDGEIMVIDRAAKIEEGDIVLGLINNTDFCVKYYAGHQDGSIFLRSENPKYKMLSFPDDSQFEIWGKVVGTVQKFK